MDTLEKFHIYIYKETKVANQINDKNTITYNIFFDKIIKKHTIRGIPHYLVSHNSTNRPQS
jgi:hypothetical protein